jgi:hypothetical protein
MSEGGEQSFGVLYSASRGFSLKTVTTTQTPYISIRLKSASPEGVAKLLTGTVFGSTADDLNIQVIFNPTLTGATFAAASAGNIVEVDTAATALTGGTVIWNAYVRATNSASNAIDFSDFVNALNTWLGVSVAGVADILTLSAACATGSADITGSVTWLEMP